MTKHPWTRRDVLTAGIGGAAAAALGGGLAGKVAQAADQPPARKQALRAAFLTDVHLQPELAAPAGLAACLHHVQGHAHKPDFIITGGDSIMDAFGQDKERTSLQWKLWHDTFRQECSLPVESCIGNHDVWGWNRKASGATPDDPQYGKKWATEALRMSNRYRSFDRNGWHFIILDSIHLAASGDDYLGRLDDEQFAWLTDDLNKLAGQRPVCISSHIPILSACTFFGGSNQHGEQWILSGKAMHVDATRIKDLFLRHPNVKLCLSGHVHLVDRVEYDGVTYLCNGAVCGGWWKGNNQECEEGYSLVDFYDDGSFERQYVGYGWQPRKS